jgi:hypothetical protein
VSDRDNWYVHAIMSDDMLGRRFLVVVILRFYCSRTDENKMRAQKVCIV